uniref:Uncharacterized protein n=1 Tax=Tetradesmus obliquus TaxID=3088 RepID=A0A383VGJ5_TETOB|eukprot:jgi/Sobl393_1/19544/SZX64321.1
MASSAMADRDKQTQQRQAGQDRPVMGYPVIAVCDSPNWGNASLINHPAESTFNMTTMKRLYGAAATAGGVKQLPPWHDFVPHGTAVKATQRPIFPCSKKNTDTIDRQEARDRREFNATAHKYRNMVPHAYHHHHKASLSGSCPEDHVYPDKGKARPGWCASASLFDPITASSRPISSPGRTEMRPCSCSHCSAPPQQHCTSSSSSSSSSPVAAAPRRPGTARAVQGRYNPLTHTWIDQPDAAAQVRQKESDRIHGYIGLRTSPLKKASAQPWAGCYDEAAAPSASTAAAAEAGSASSSSSGATGSSEASAAEAKSLGKRSSSLRYHGDTWGTYDVLRHEWRVPPKSQAFAQREAAPNGLSFDRSSAGFSHTKRVPLPASQGVYDPIRGEWKVQPRNGRVMAGLEFTPRKVFDDKAFVKR